MSDQGERRTRAAQSPGTDDEAVAPWVWLADRGCWRHPAGFAITRHSEFAETFGAFAVYAMGECVPWPSDETEPPVTDRDAPSTS